MTERDANGGQGTRIERDSMGEMAVPVDALYGAQTQRAVQNFQLAGPPISPCPPPRAGLIKRAAALANRDLGVLAADARRRRGR